MVITGRRCPLRDSTRVGPSETSLVAATCSGPAATLTLLGGGLVVAASLPGIEATAVAAVARRRPANA